MHKALCILIVKVKGKCLSFGLKTKRVIMQMGQTTLKDRGLLIFTEELE